MRSSHLTLAPGGARGPPTVVALPPGTHPPAAAVAALALCRAGVPCALVAGCAPGTGAPLLQLHAFTALGTGVLRDLVAEAVAAAAATGAPPSASAAAAAAAQPPVELLPPPPSAAAADVARAVHLVALRNATTAALLEAGHAPCRDGFLRPLLPPASPSSTSASGSGGPFLASWLRVGLSFAAAAVGDEADDDAASSTSSSSALPPPPSLALTTAAAVVRVLPMDPAEIAASGGALDSPLPLPAQQCGGNGDGDGGGSSAVAPECLRALLLP